MQLTGTTRFDSGMVELRYEIKALGTAGSAARV
jgi:hypothetical protein